MNDSIKKALKSRIKLMRSAESHLENCAFHMGAQGYVSGLYDGGALEFSEWNRINSALYRIRDKMTTRISRKHGKETA